MGSFETFVAQTASAKTPESLFLVLQDALKNQGYDRVLFAILSPHHEIGLKPGIGVIQNYPLDWMNYYFEQKLDQIDPIPRYAAQCLEAFSWAEVAARLQLSPRQRKCLAQGEEAGLYNGVGVPLRGPRGEIAGISVATTEKQDACVLNPDLLTAYCNQFYLAFKRLHKPSGPPPVNFYLTPKEKNVLTWVARGWSEEKVADYLAMSPHTVNMHMRHIAERFGVKGRVAVVARALHYGLIEYQNYEFT